MTKKLAHSLTLPTHSPPPPPSSLRRRPAELNYKLRYSNLWLFRPLLVAALALSVHAVHQLLHINSISTRLDARIFRVDNVIMFLALPSTQIDVWGVC